MGQLNLKSLIGRLNSTSRAAFEAALALGFSRFNYEVDVEHLLAKLLENPASDFSLAVRSFGIDASRLSRDLTQVLDRMKSGSSKGPGLSPSLVRLIREAWLLASIEFGASQIRSIHLLLALLSDDMLSRMVADISSELSPLTADELRREMPKILANSTETDGGGLADGKASAGPITGARPTGSAATPNLDQFTIDLTARAKAGKIDPVLGRDSEIRQIVDILTRRRQNNPILTGEAGVGKTAVVEGFAQRIATGDVPPSLRNVVIRSLDLTLLQAGAGIKGEFENRLKSVIEEVNRSPIPIILFIDEAHTMIGAGGAAGQGDAANILKPALARGELRTIAATTWAEYKKYFEKDAALARRFQVVKVEEPSEAAAIEMMRGLVATLETHHSVRVLDEAVSDSVRLSHRYISGRQLPDKSVSLLDTACARVALAQSATPPRIEDAQRRIEQLIVSLEILGREQAVGTDHQERISEAEAEKTTTEAELAALKERWDAEKKLVGQIREIRTRLEKNATAKEGEADRLPLDMLETSRTQLGQLNQQLEELQGEAPLIQVCVDGQAVAEVVSAWTGIPVGRMVANEIQTVLSLKDRMEDAIIGQSHALEAIAQRIRTSRAKLSDPRTPIGVFLLAGTSGVGKTETAITLANLLYGGEQNMTVINMSEFKEEHKVSLLMGSPPGYVGYGEGGVLTEAVRRKPYSVVLLDEMEKAHPGVQDIFYQVFDKGQMKDGEGRDIDFKNTLIIMTTNAGTDLIKSLCADPETRPDPEALAKTLHADLLKTFKPAFLGRLSVVPYYPLTDDVMAKIIELKLGKVVRRIRENYRAAMTYAPEILNAIAKRCTEVDTGARNVDHILTGSLLPQLSAEFLGRLAEGGSISKLHVGLNESGKFEFQLT